MLNYLLISQFIFFLLIILLFLCWICWLFCCKYWTNVSWNLNVGLMAWKLKVSVANFFQNPIFLKGSSVFLHLVLFLGIIGVWVYTKLRGGLDNNPKNRTSRYYKPVFFTSMALSLYNTVLGLLDYFHWYKNGWTDEKLGTLLDLAIRAFTWLLFSVCLHTQFRHSSCHKWTPLIWMCRSATGSKPIMANGIIKMKTSIIYGCMVNFS